MSLTRREILEQLSRLGIKTIDDLKKGCREYEAYWSAILEQSARQCVPGSADPLMQELP